MIYRIRLASIMKILPNKRFFSPQYRNLFGQDFPAALFEIRAQELEIYEISRPNRMFLLAFFFRDPKSCIKYVDGTELMCDRSFQKKLHCSN